MTQSNITSETAPAGTTLVLIEAGAIVHRYTVAKWTPSGQIVCACGERFRPRPQGGYYTNLRILTPDLERADAALRQRGRHILAVQTMAEKIYRVPAHAWRQRAFELFPSVEDAQIEEAHGLLRRAAELLGVA